MWRPDQHSRQQLSEVCVLRLCLFVCLLLDRTGEFAQQANTVSLGNTPSLFLPSQVEMGQGGGLTNFPRLVLDLICNPGRPRTCDPPDSAFQVAKVIELYH